MVRTCDRPVRAEILFSGNSHGAAQPVVGCGGPVRADVERGRARGVAGTGPPDGGGAGRLSQRL